MPPSYSSPWKRRRRALPPRRAAENGVPGAGAPEEPGEFLSLGVAVVEVLRDERELKDVTVPEEGLVVAEEGGMRHRSVWRRGDC